MKQRYIVVDVALCHDCNNCFVACKDEHVMNDWMPYTEEQPRHGHRWMNIERTERGQFPRIEVGFLPKPCQHCADAPCIKANPDCISRREDGVVLIDVKKAKGKKEVLESCPYGAIYWNEEFKSPQKCTMCAHLLDDGWEMPRCVHGCPTGAMAFYTMEPADMQKKVAEEKLEHYRADLNSNPHVYYKNLYKFTKSFIAGGIIKDNDCLENAEVTLTGNGVKETMKTNYFGDFKFDHLDPGEYVVTANGKEISKVKIDKSVNLGNISI